MPPSANTRNPDNETVAAPLVSRLRRDLGTVESYAALIGILIGAGIFKVTSDAWRLTGPSVILGYAVLMPAILATSIPYAAFISTPLGREPGGEYLHISRTLGGFRLAFIGAWLKIIAYVGAGAYLATALIFILMSVVAFGVLPGTRLGASSAPMTEVALVYLPWGAAAFVTLGAIMAITTSLNPTLIVPSRMALIFVEDGLTPRWLGVVNPRTATPVRALTLNMLACLILLVSNQLALALNIAVFALVLLYFLHSLTFLILPRRNPRLYGEITIGLPVWLQRGAALLSVLSMGILIVVQVANDLNTLGTTSLGERVDTHSLTSLELAVTWSIVGAVLYVVARWMRKREESRAS